MTAGAPDHEPVLPFFSCTERTDQRLAKFAEPTFEYLDISARASSSAIRSIIGGWLNHYPALHIRGLIRRLRTPEKANAAFFELYLHELFACLGLHPVVEPSLSQLGGRPDLMITENERRTVVEAAWMGEDAREQANRKVHDAILDTLNSIQSKFLFSVEPSGHPKTPIPLRKLRRHVGEFVRNLNYDECLQKAIASQYGDLASTVFIHEGFMVDIEAIPEQGESSDQRIAHVGPFPMIFDGGERLKRTLRKKARRYRNLSCPYVVAISVPEFDLVRHEWMNALFGSLEYVWGETNRRCSPRRRKNGAWSNQAGPVYRGVSATLLIPILTPWTFAVAEPVLIHNPWARFPLLGFTSSMSQEIPSEGRMVFHQGRPVLEVLGIRPDLPSLIRTA